MNKSDKPKPDREARRQALLERLGVDFPRCLLCGEDDPRVLERHHLAGRTYGMETVIMCANDHRKLSDDQKDHPDALAAELSPIEKAARFLLGLADFFCDLAETLREYANGLLLAAMNCPAPWGSGPTLEGATS